MDGYSEADGYGNSKIWRQMRSCGKKWGVHQIWSRGFCYEWRYPNFLLTECSIGRKKLPSRNPARFVQSFRCNVGLWRTYGRTDIQTDKRTQDDSIHRTSIASCGKSVQPRSHGTNCSSLTMQPSSLCLETLIPSQSLGCSQSVRNGQ